MEITASQLKRKQINEMIDILKGYLLVIKKLDMPEEYRHEISYFKEIITGLLIDLSLGDKSLLCTFSLNEIILLSNSSSGLSTMRASISFQPSNFAAKYLL